MLTRYTAEPQSQNYSVESVSAIYT